MPLIIITGLPCSGKTYRAEQIATQLEAYIASDPSLSKRSVQIIQSHHASLDRKNTPSSSSDQSPTPENQPNEISTLRDEIYNSASREKTARAEEFSAIKRALSKDNIVIADGLNYIKGYRYQLWCEAKAAATRCCVVHVAAQEDECQKWNRERMRVWGIEEEDGGDKRDVNKGAIDANSFGELAPESHTAIYGDRMVEKPSSRSRSSSMDGMDSDDEESRPRRPVHADDDGMTLKSLYIGNQAPETTQSSRDARGITNATTTTPPEQRTPSPLLPPSSTSIAAPPPPPTSSPPYLPSTLKSLLMRYEPPSPFSRWDTPLFTIPSFDITIPTSQIWEALYPTPAKPTSKKALSQLSSRERSGFSSQEDNNTKNGISSTQPPSSMVKNASSVGVKQHAATILPQSSTADALQTLESTTMEVVKQLLARAREVGVGGSVNSDGGDLTMTMTANPLSGVSGDQNDISVTMHIPPGLTLSQPLLQRLRRKYTQIQRAGIAHGQGYVQGRAAIVEGFIGFLDGEWNPDE
ncbi:hypothetical protein PV10_01452 [Exophiala mesophila]|uniref:Protein KTI12 n=1 Tax=Exophiala mesophila TaxID=212818 RepID=A0A0D1ZT30_EXOME|nr:uncharacterized protein PV10_01452 [Exophiala mesophila]KIV97742.1 hypothetical protein PV10_01452 [Exophiala mesophila]